MGNQGETALHSFVRLRVGGETFETSRDTLLNDKGTLFHALLSDSWKCSCDGTGAIMIDRDPKRFRVLLNFLRTRTLVLEDGVTADALRQEAEYFHVEAAVHAALQLSGPKECQQLLKCVVDARKGILLSLAPGETRVLPLPGNPLQIRLDKNTNIVSVCARCSAVSAHTTGMCVVVDGNVDPSFVTHVDGDLSVLHAVGRLGPGLHDLSIQYCNIHFRERACVYGPLRLEVWQCFEEVVDWHNEPDFSKPETICSAVIGSWTCGTGVDAAALSQAVLAIEQSAYT